MTKTAQYTENTIYAIAGDATLTARWTANIYEITLDANGGVTDVALDSGYSSVSAFISTFKQVFGRTPGRVFRTRNGR